MTNTELFYAKAKSSGYKLSHIASASGMTRQSLQNKVRNRTEFKASEIARLRYVLNLSAEELDLIFFA